MKPAAKLLLTVLMDLDTVHNDVCPGNVSDVPGSLNDNLMHSYSCSNMSEIQILVYFLVSH